jgi:hypothetical protein
MLKLFESNPYEKKIRIERLIEGLIILSFLNGFAFGQSTNNEKQISYNNHTWLSVNSTMRFTDYWGLMADFHIQKEFFFNEDIFYFLRLGAVNWIDGKYPVAYGVAHMWLAPEPGNKTWTNENRIYEQWSATHNEGIFQILHRIRTEQRWREVVVNDQKTGNKQFNFRLRYLASFSIQFFQNDKLPLFVISDEVHVQFGKDIGVNTFDQNRLFIGLKQSINSYLCFDIGYMNILQQKSTPYKYDSNDVFRLFFYYSPDFRKKGIIDPAFLEGGE